MASTRKRGESYEIIVSCGYDTDGKKIKRTSTWTPSVGMTEKQIEKELERQKVIFEEKVKAGNAPDATIKFSQYIDLWLRDYGETQLSIKRLKRDKELLTRIIPALGHIRLDRLRPAHLLEFYRVLSEPGQNKTTGGYLSENTILDHHRLISAMLGVAVQWGMLPDNPASKVKPPRVPHSEIDFYDEQQAAELLSALDDEPLKYKLAITLLLYTGMRRGELLGLEWRDIDFNTGVIRVERTSQYTPETGIFTKEPKTKGSTRKVTVPQNIVDMLGDYQEFQRQQKAAVADRWIETGRLFIADDGNYMPPDTILRWFTSFLARHNLPHLSLHGLRHTSATVLITSGVDIRTVSQRLGHQRTSTTLDRYTHAVEARDKLAADKMAEIFGKTT